MKKILLACFLFAVAVCAAGCVAPRQFEISLKEGLFQGTSDRNPALTVSVEFSEMDRAEYVKTHENKVKDLSTTDTKFYTPYHVDLVISEGNENYVLKFAELAARNVVTTDTYRVKNLQGDAFLRALDLSDVTLKLADHDGDKTVDELTMDFLKNGEADRVILKFISAGGETSYEHRNFRYNCRLTCDAAIKFSEKAGDTFWAGSELSYEIGTIEGYKVVMYVNGEPYTEIDPIAEVMRFRYVTGYRDVDIDFRAVKK